MTRAINISVYGVSGYDDGGPLIGRRLREPGCRGGLCPAIFPFGTKFGCSGSGNHLSPCKAVSSLGLDEGTGKCWARVGLRGIPGMYAGTAWIVLEEGSGASANKFDV